MKEHQITAFWHGFGISNELHIPKEYVRLHKYSKGTPREVYAIAPEFMRKQLKEYINWLKSYKENWDKDEVYDCHPKSKAEFLESEARNENRADILEMIELLQECRIDDK